MTARKASIERRLQPEYQVQAQQSMRAFPGIYALVSGVPWEAGDVYRGTKADRVAG